MTDTNTTTMATAESLLAAICPREPVDLPGLGRVWVWGLTDLEVQQWIDDCERDPDDPDRLKDAYQNAKLLQRTVRNENGTPIFNPHQVTRLVNLPNAIKQRLLAVARRLSALGEGVDEDTLKNCVKTHGSGS